MLNSNTSKDTLYIRVIRLALEYPEGFKYSDIINNDKLDLNDWEKNTIDRHFLYACRHFTLGDKTKGETIFLFIHGQYDNHKSEENKYILNFEAEFTFIDYQELKFARKNAKEARILALIAIIISVIAILASLLITQKVMIDDNQFQKIINSIGLQTP